MGPQDESGKLFLHLRLGECSFFTITTFTSGVGFILRGCAHPTQHKSKFWLCDLGGVAVVKIGEFLCDPWRSWWKLTFHRRPQAAGEMGLSGSSSYAVFVYL